MNYLVIILAAGFISIAALSGCDKAEQSAVNEPAGAQQPGAAAPTPAAGQPLAGDTPDLNDEEDEAAEADNDSDEASDTPAIGGEEREIVSDQEEAPIDDAPEVPAEKSTRK